jgi:hypothetical protein
VSFPPAGISEQAVREELGRVLASHEFRSSKRSQAFLKYVVENTLSGNADILKERTIGIEVFGRSTSYDPSDDATVRVKAGEVRKRLGLYYAGQGTHDPVRIEMPAGTYVPEFRGVEAGEGAVPPAPPVLEAAARADDVPEAPARSRGSMLAVAALGLLLACVLVFVSSRGRSGNTVLDRFWSPVLKGADVVSLCAAYVPVYALDRVPTPDRPIRAEDFISLTDQFVGGGDLVAISRLSKMLTALKRPYKVKVGSEVSFADLRTSPAVLVGYSYTRWKEISSQLRFFIDTSSATAVITDNGSPTKWSLPNLPPDRRTNEDFAIVTRVFHPDTHAMLVEVAGITQYGTQAAADLVTTPDLMAEALRRAPEGWQTKNLQLVLHVKVIAGAPGSPSVVATHFW